MTSDALASRRARARGDGSIAGRLRAALAGGVRGRRGRSPHRPRRRALPRAGPDRRRRRGGAARADRPRAAAPAASRSPRCDAVGRALPDLPAVACFDTAFHATLPAAAATYALPAAVARALGAAPLRLPRPLARLGRAPCARAARARSRGAAHRQLPPRRRRLAVRDRRRDARSTRRWASRRSRASSWRPARGSVDPGMLLWLAEHAGPSGTSSAERALEHRVGAARLAGSADMREVLARARPRTRQARARARRLPAPPARRDRRDGRGARRHRRAGLHRRRRRALGGRARAGADGLGVPRRRARSARNREVRADADVSSAGAGAAVLVIAAREDLEIARQTREVLAQAGGH